MLRQSSKTSSAIHKAIAVLEILARDVRPLGAPDIADQLGTSRQTVHRIIAQLEEIGLVQRDATRERFLLGVRFNELAISAITSSHHNKLCHVILERLVSKVRETCNVGVLDSNEVIYIDRVECDWPLRVQLQPGSRLPVYCTAIGKLLLAHLPQKLQDHYLDTVKLAQLTENTITDPDTFRAALGEIREQGFSINNQEDSVGLIAIAVPIQSQSGTMMAGLAIHGPEARLSTSRAKELIPTLTEAASAISRALFG